MSKLHKSHEVKPRSDFWPSVRLLLTIVLIGMLPVVLQQFEVHREGLQLAGRCLAGVGALLVVLALVKEVGKVVAVVAVFLLVGMLMVSEGWIEPPHLLR